MVRTDLLEQVPTLATQAIECSNRLPALANVVSEHLLPLVVHNLGTSDSQVRTTAHSTLFFLLEQAFVTREQAELQVCPTVLGMSKVENMMDLNTSAITVSFCAMCFRIVFKI